MKTWKIAIAVCCGMIVHDILKKTTFVIENQVSKAVHKMRHGQSENHENDSPYAGKKYNRTSYADMRDRKIGFGEGY